MMFCSDQDHNALLSLMLNRRAHMNRYVKECFGRRVIDGLFSGVALSDLEGFENTDFSAKILGYYEAEVQTILGLCRDVPYSKIINVGAAEGFYAVGLAAIFPQAKVVAFEMDPGTIPFLTDAIRANQFESRIRIEGECGIESLNRECAGEFPLIVMDCEGGEETLIPGLLPENAKAAHFLIEIHDRDGTDVYEDLARCLAPTHLTVYFVQGARDPNKYPQLRRWSEIDRWLAVSEFRGQTFRWMLAVPHGGIPEALRPMVGQ
jgi:hypothetical protein